MLVSYGLENRCPFWCPLRTPYLLNHCCTHSWNWRRGSESNRRIQLLQSRALPLGYPADLPPKAYIYLPSTQVLFCQPFLSTPFAHSLWRLFSTHPALRRQPGAVFPQAFRFDCSNGRDDPGDQLRRGHVESGVARAAGWIGDPHINRRPACALARLTGTDRLAPGPEHFALIPFFNGNLPARGQVPINRGK